MENCLSYKFIYGVYGKNACHTNSYMVSMEKMLVIQIHIWCLWKKCLAYKFKYGVYGKNACRTIFIQNFKMVLKS